jgi:hypothetical protein
MSSLRETPCPKPGCGQSFDEIGPVMTCGAGHRWKIEDVTLAASRALAEQTVPLNGRAVGAAESSFLVSPFKERNEKRESGAAGFRITSLAQLQAQPLAPQSWRVDGVLVEDGTSLWAAKPKCGKSVTLRALAHAVATGRPFLGRATRPGTVLLVSLEDRARRVRDHFERLGDLDEVGDRIALHIGAAPDHAVDELASAVQTIKPSLVIVDTISRLVRFRDINDYSEVTTKLEPVGELARRAGCHIAMSHHLGKGERLDAGDGVLGSTALFGAVDTLVILKRRPDGTRIISTVQREGADLEEAVLSLDDRGAVALGPGVAQQRESEAEAAVLAALGREEITEEEIRARAGGNTGLVGGVLRTLRRTGVVMRTGAGKKGDPFVYRVRGAGWADQENELNEENEQ